MVFTFGRESGLRRLPDIQVVLGYSVERDDSHGHHSPKAQRWLDRGLGGSTSNNLTEAPRHWHVLRRRHAEDMIYTVRSIMTEPALAARDTANDIHPEAPSHHPSRRPSRP